MAARIIIGVLALVFLILAVSRIVRDGGRWGPAARTWLLIGLIFAAVTLWQWLAARRG
jgi:hypothetical protein